MSAMKAISIRQPYCGAISFGDKRIENRGRTHAIRACWRFAAGESR